MGPRGKIIITIILIIIVALGVWQLTSPLSIPSVGTKYLPATLASHQASYMEDERTGTGTLFLGISISNITYAREALSTSYSIVISKINQTINSNIVRSYTVKVTSLTILDNYDGTSTGFDAHSNLTDAVQVLAPFTFSTPNDPSAPHQLRFTMTYDVYNLYFFGYSVDHSQTRALNTTQNIL
jgi:hypothetical protein